MTTTKTYDKLNRLSNISSVNSQPSTINSFTYQYNNANQRIRTDLADGTHWEYTYDLLGQVISGKRYWQDGTPVAGQQYEYAFDDIGNRKSTAVGGDANGSGLRSASYTPNYVNQISSRTVPAYVDVLGIANPTASVTVNGNTAYRKGEYFDYALSTPNGGAPWFNTVTIASTYPPGQNSAGSMFVPQTPEAYTPDLDGNLTQDGRWSYTWDGENRLVQIVKRFPTTDLAKITHPTTGVPTLFEKVAYQYDHQGRRIAKHYFATAAAPTPFGSYVYVYDGWNLLTVLKSDLSLLSSFTWGLDLSGTMQGAGGVGGLLWMSEITGGAVTEAHFAAYDGNGNVAALVKASDGAETARYEYGPFGEPVRMTGAKARVNPFQFSTKFTDDETGMLYYGYRSYNPSTGRWLSRDPIGEKGGRNLYAFVANRPPNAIDWLGLCKVGEKRNVKCNSHVSDWTSNPDLDGAKGDLVDLAGDVEKFDTFLDIVQIALNAGKSLAEAIAEAAGTVFDNGVTVDGKELAKRLNDILKEGHGKWGGWNLYTRLDYEECQECWFGLSTKWKKMPPTAWREYKKGGIDGKGTFEEDLDAYRSTKKACAEHIKEFNKGSTKP